METVMINVRNKADVKWLMGLAKRINAPARAVDTETLNDAWLAAMIDQGMNTESVARDEVMKALDR